MLICVNVGRCELKSEVDQMLRFMSILAVTLVALIFVLKHFDYQHAKLKVIEKQGVQYLQKNLGLGGPHENKKRRK